MTARNTWKEFERRIARLFGSERSPLSGENGKITGSDSLHDRLYIECKLREHHTVYTLWAQTAKRATPEGKTPLLALQEKGKHGALLVIHTASLDELIVERLAANPELFYAAQQRLMGKNGE